MRKASARRYSGMPNKTVHCKICGAGISGSSFRERMAKIRRHYAKHHPAAWRRAVRKAVQTKMSKGNPKTHKVAAKLRQTFKAFHDYDPSRVMRIKIRNRLIPKNLVLLGRLVDISYSSDKWHKGKRVNYIHKFKNRPFLATNEGGDAIYVIGGNIKVGPEGITG
jgi:hypothetical protein